MRASRILAALLGAVCVAGATPAAAAQTVPPAFASNAVEVPEGVERVWLRDGRPVLLTRTGRLLDIDATTGVPVLTPAPPQVTTASVPADIVPHGRVAYGTRDIRRAWLAGPTDAYDHAVLGDAVEASTLRVETAGGAELSVEAGSGHVFEDLWPRLADLDGDGRDEIMVVRTSLTRGASLAVYRVGVDGRLAFVAQTRPIGSAWRWLNPVGAGDFDGDGETDVALVATPHIGGQLRVYRLGSGILRRTGYASGYANHASGSTELDLSAVADVDADGTDDILVPDQSRTRLVAVSYAGGVFRELGDVRHPVPIASAIVLWRPEDRVMAAYALEDGTLVVTTLPPGATQSTP